MSQHTARNWVAWIVLCLLFPMGMTLSWELHRTRLALTDAELWSDLAENTTTGVCIVSAKTGDIRAWNPSAERITGWARKDVLGKHVTIIMPVGFRDLHQKYLSEPHTFQQISSTVLTMECALLRSDNTEIVARIVVRAFRGNTVEGGYFSLSFDPVENVIDVTPK
jgi:PAS domain S-box-containing protein